MNINLNASSPGERIVLAVVIVGLLIDLMDVEWTAGPTATPITYEQCFKVCENQNTYIRKLESYSCECTDFKN